MKLDIQCPRRFLGGEARRGLREEGQELVPIVAHKLSGRYFAPILQSTERTKANKLYGEYFLALALVREQFPWEMKKSLEELVAEYQSAKSSLLAERVAEELAIALAPQLHWFIRLHCPEEEAEDVLQETLVAICHRMDQAEAGHFKGWCYKIAAHKCADCFRRERRRPLQYLAPEELEEILHRDAEDDPIEADEEQDLAYALKLLAEVGADCVEFVSLHFLCDLTFPEIAEIWDSTKDAVRMKVHRCCGAARAAHERRHSCV